jgi:hypothetical protein
MSVITCYQDADGLRSFDVYAKGAPEMIRSLSLSNTSDNSVSMIYIIIND